MTNKSLNRDNVEPTDSATNSLLLPGLDGTNPLGFLASIGVLRILSSWRSPLRMKWAMAEGTWVPMIFPTPNHAADCDTILDALCEGLDKDIATHPAQLLERVKTTSDGSARRNVFCEVLAQSRHSLEDRAWADWLAAIASDIAPADAINQLQTARRDYYYKNLASVMEKATRDHLRRSLFCRWDYADPLDNQSLHLDPSEDRRHALQWNQPSGDPDRKRSGGMLGANRLAIEAIPLFTSLPEDAILRTIGFTGSRSTDARWTWPIWNVGITLPVVRSLLLARDLQQETPTRAEVGGMRARGVVAIFRSRRILIGKTPNFTPARCILSTPGNVPVKCCAGTKGTTPQP